MIRIALQFGFTPAARVRLPKASKEPSWLEGVHTMEEIGADLKPLQLD
jgi:phage terminase small subunit